MGNLHARVISRSTRATLKYIVDPRVQEGRESAEKFSTSWKPELPRLDDIDAVVIAAATEAHFPLAMQVLTEGKPVLVEKPVADSLLRTQEILSLAEERDIPLMCGLLERFNPAVITAKAMIDHPVHIVATRHSPYAPRIKTGVAWDLLVHDVDLAVQLMGAQPIENRGELGFYHPNSLHNAEDVAESLLRFDGGEIARISASRIGQKKVRELSIHEVDKLIEVDLLRRDVTMYRHVAADNVSEGLGFRQQTIIEIPELVTNTEPLTAQFDHFVDLIEGRIDSKAERESILPSHRVIEEITRLRPEV